MAEYTPNFNLIKPRQEDFYNVEEFNANFEKIDQNAVKKGEGIAELTGGTLAQRPAPGIIGRYYFAQDTGEIYLDTGTEWVLAAAGQVDLANLQNTVNTHLADIVTDADGAHGLKVEKGTWSATIAGETTQGVATYTTRNCSYVRIGDLVTCNFAITATLTSATGNLILSGFPFLQKGFNNSGVVAFATVIASIKTFSNLSERQNFRFINNNNTYVNSTEVVDKGSFQIMGQVTYEITYEI